MAAAVVAAFVLVVGAAFLIGMRSGSPRTRRVVRRFNRAVTNRIVRRSAGGEGASAGLIHHVGRRSGRAYETPIGPFPTEDGFLVALPYGPDVDWVRNVVASGSATLDFEGETYVVTDPEVVATDDAWNDVPESEKRVLRTFRVGQCLRLSRAHQPGSQVDAEASRHPRVGA